MTKKVEHVHKLRRLRYKSGNEIYFCALPDCNKKLQIALALGKRSICWRCGEPFIMNEYSLRLAKPHCEDCHRSKKEIIKFEDYVVPEAEGNITPPLSLAERLNQTIKQAQIEGEDEI